MKSSLKILAAALAVAFTSSAALAQRTRPVEQQGAGSKGSVVVPAPPPAPPSVKAKYEGGLVGYKKSDGTVNFDDQNERLVFRDKSNRELFSLPYETVMIAYADTQARRPTAATVVGSVPLPYGANIPAWFVRKKYRYMVLQYRDPDTQAQGVANFKLENKEILASVLNTLAQKAGLTQRGDAFVRRRPTDDPDTDRTVLRTRVPIPPPDERR